MKEGMCCDKHWVLYVNDESVNFIPETNITLNVNLNLNKNLKKKKIVLTLKVLSLCLL